MGFVDQMVLRDHDADNNAATGSLGQSASGMEQRLYAQQDANYNVTSLTNTAGTVVERYLYDPYGAATYKTGTWGSRSSSSYGQVYLFQGLRYDNATGFYHARNRDFSPVYGRWIQQDPAGYVDGLNLYQAHSSNPVSRVDPTGLWDEAGHFWLTYMTAVAAGMDPSAAYELAYYSQLPDTMQMTDAATLWKMLLGARLHNDGQAATEQAIAELEQWAKEVFDQLHQLHGGDEQEVFKRRECLKKMLKDGNLKPWERGFVNHALGDSYAHTYKDKNGREKAYGWPDGHAPDHVGLRPHLASSYAYNLYLALGGSADPTPEQWNLMRTIYGNLRARDATAQTSWMSNIARGQFGFNFSPYVPNPKFKQPSLGEIADLLKKMKKACCCP
jgi:RHS repeat-associated protein